MVRKGESIQGTADESSFPTLNANTIEIAVEVMRGNLKRIIFFA
jgi:hypothetical protein